MDRNLDINNFERLLKDRSEEFKMYPTKRVWHSIYNNIHPGRKWPSIAMCIVLISILLLVGFLNTNNIETNLMYNASLKPSRQTVSLEKIIPSIYNLFSLNTSLHNLNTVNKPEKGFKTNSTYTNNTAILITPTKDNLFTSKTSNITARKNASSNLIVATNTSAKVNNSQNKNGDHVHLNSNSSSLISHNLASSKSIVTANPSQNYKNLIPISAQFNEINEVVKVQNKSDKSEKNILSNDVLATDNLSEENLAVLVNDETLSLTKSNALSLLKKDIINITTNKKLIKAFTKKDSLLSAPLKLSDEDKDWVENYALYNKSAPKKWAGKLGLQFYITPSVVYRTLKNIIPGSKDINNYVSQHPSIGFEVGGGIIYPFFKGVKIKTGLQVNFTRYNVDAYQNSHPIVTTTTMVEDGKFYQDSKTTPFSNLEGITPAKLHNDTYQLSIPIGLDFKIAGNDELQWNIGATIQPSYVFGGTSYLISTDKRNLIAETSLINRFNLNAGFETFISYKVNGYTLQLGPQFRKQLFTTNTKEYTIQEKLYNYGIKFGITKIIK